jgi:hypothetical protein
MQNFFQNDITFLHRGLPVWALSRSSGCNARKLQRIQLGISKGTQVFIIYKTMTTARTRN